VVLPGAAGGEEAVVVQGVRFAYQAGPPVLEDVSFSIAQGEFTSIIGPNGGGKSTLIKLVLGLLAPDAGRVRVLGRSPERARPMVGYLPQHATVDPRFPASVLEVVLMGRVTGTHPLGPYTGRDREAAARALARVELEGFEKRPFPALSGGERQRVLVARALASEPRLLLLDEPAAGLDQRVERDFLELLRELGESMTVVLVSHDLGFVSELVSTVVCVSRRVVVHPTSAIDGRIIRDIYGGDVRMVRHDRHEDH
jgi:zinc transport system ATP-binding protein